MKILLRLPNWLGDVVMSTALIQSVKKLYPDANVDIIIKKELAGIARLIPGINTIHPFSKQLFSGLPGAYKFGKTLKKEKYDIFFNLPASLSSLMLAWASCAKKRIGFSEEGGRFFLTNAYAKDLTRHRVDEYLFLLEQFSGKRISEREVKLQITETVNPDKNSVLLNFNSEASSRRMPVDKARSIVTLLLKSFKNIRFTFIGSPKEFAFVEEIMNGIDHNDRLKNFAGKTDLVALTTLMASAAAILTTDSGPAHLANSVGTPTVVLFGAGNESNTAPYNKHLLSVIRAGRLQCEPCVHNTCELYGVPKCMQLLDELQIINSLGLYLQNA